MGVEDKDERALVVNSCDVSESFCMGIVPVRSSHVLFSKSLDLIPSIPIYLPYYVIYPPLEESLTSYNPPRCSCKYQ